MLLGLWAFGWVAADIGVGLEMRGLGESATKDNQLGVPLRLQVICVIETFVAGK